MRTLRARFVEHEWLIHLLSWGLFLAVSYAILPVPFLPPLKRRVTLSFFINSGLLVSVFYLYGYSFSKHILRRRNLLLFFGILAGSLGLFLCVNSLLAPKIPFPAPADVFIPRQPPTAERPRAILLPFPGPIFNEFLLFLCTICFSTIWVLVKDWLKTKEQKQEMAYRRLAAELSMLKLQISPHFLFNTLNNIRSLVRSQSDLAAEDAIVKLSELLRYILYQANNEQTALSREIEHLQDYIELQKMRLPSRCTFSFTYSGNVDDKLIVPLLLIPLVENVFKHGVHGKEKTEIRVQLVVEGQQLRLRTRNRCFPDGENRFREASGIGLTNLKRRLVLYYSGKHRLTIQTPDGWFDAELILLLN